MFESAQTKTTHEEIVGELIFEAHRWNDTVILKARNEDGQTFTVKATASEHELSPGLTYRFYGHWTTHHRHGRQFAAQSQIVVTPHFESGVIAYLQRGPRIGLVIAKSIWAAFGSESVKTLRETPDVVVETLREKRVRGFTQERARAAAMYFDQCKQLEDAEIDVIGVIGGRGFPRDTLCRAIGQWGNKAADTIRRNPFLLMRFPGCGFARTDALYLELGHDPARLKRQTLCIWHGISRDMSGSTWFPATTIDQQLRRYVAGATVNPVRACRLGIRAGVLAVRRNGTALPFITERRRDRAEQVVADSTARLNRSEAAWPTWPNLSQTDLTPHQVAELSEALRQPVGVFLGSAGTGKTFSAARLIQKLLETEKPGAVAVVAPTGKAAVRITEVLGEHGVTIRARTIHSYLKVRGFEEGYGGGFSFKHGPKEPVAERFVVVDEASMVDTELLAHLLNAMRDDGHLLLVGDTQQLPPVSHGAPLRDLIDAGIAHGELTEIHRNAGAIVRTCSAIREGVKLRLPRKLGDLDGPMPQNLMIAETKSGEESRETILKIIRSIRRNDQFDPVWDVQVLCAVNDKSPLSRKALNAALQAELNGRNRPEEGSEPFWRDDKVICLANSLLPALTNDDDEDDDLDARIEDRDDNDKVYVANGEIGRVIRNEPRRLILEFAAPSRLIIVPKGEDGSVRFDLGYAVSTHKCVGGDTIVQTEQGFCRIDSIPTDAKMIATAQGLMPFKNYTKNPVGELLEIETSHGYKLSITPDHKMMSWNGDTYVLKEGKDLCCGDFLRLRLNDNAPEDVEPTTPIARSTKRNAKEYNIPGRLTCDLAEFLGLMVADGVLISRNGSPQGLRLVKRHDSVLRRFRELCVGLFGIEPRKVSILGTDGYEVFSSYIALWLFSFPELHPNKKAIPKIVLRAGARQQSSFLRGLFEDGTVNIKDGRADHVEFATSSKELARLVQILLLRQGIASTRSVFRTQHNTDGHRIYIYSNYLRVFAKRIGFVSESKNARLALRSSKSRFLVPVSAADTESFSTSDKSNARIAGHATRRVMELYKPEHEAMSWHHVKIKKITRSAGKSYCVEVPGHDRFLQNGFDGSNSQGSQWPVVIVAIDDYSGAKYVTSKGWCYTSLSRAQKACICVGRESTLHAMLGRVEIGKRVTFLADRVRETCRQQKEEVKL